jgi:hypothetical protein
MKYQMSKIQKYIVPVIALILLLVLIYVTFGYKENMTPKIHDNKDKDKKSENSKKVKME